MRGTVSVMMLFVTFCASFFNIAFGLDWIIGGGGGAVVECPTKDGKVPGSILGGAKK